MASVTQPTRLFDLIPYQLTNSQLPDMLCAREGNGWKKFSTEEVQNIVDRFSAGLLASGITTRDMSAEGRDKIAIISKNRPEWLFADLAAQQVGAVLVPVYPTIHEDELRFILQHARVKLVFVDDQDDYEKISRLHSYLPELQAVYTFEPVEGALHWKVLLLETDEQLKEKVRRTKEKINAEDLATIIYTSGTTGTPKGVMLSHRNILSDILSSYPLFEEIGIRGDRALSFLPLNHAFEKAAAYLYIYTGVSIYFAQSTATLVADLQDVKPVIFTTVPRLLEKVYEGIVAKGEKLSGIKRRLFFWALNLGLAYKINTPLSPLYRLQLALADKLVFSKWRAALGGRVKAIITGAAPCQVRLLKIFAAAGIVVQEGYGMTEASPVISGNRYSEKNRMFGTVGPVLDGIEVRLAPDGEILCKGPNVMMGYYKRPDLTDETIKDGWLHAGDIGELVDGRFLKITDRKKELFKTSGGKYIAPQPIENKMSESPWIEQMMVVGAGQKFVSALIVPSFQAIKEWYEAQGKKFHGKDTIIHDKEVIRKFRKIVEEYNRQFNPVEQIKKFRLLSAEWTIEGGELTPTLKPKRKVITAKYWETIQNIYEQ